MSFFKKVGSFLGKVGKGALKVVGGVASTAIGAVLGGGGGGETKVVIEQAPAPSTPNLTQVTGFESGRGTIENPMQIPEVVVNGVLKKTKDDSNAWTNINNSISAATMLAAVVNGEKLASVSRQAGDALSNVTGNSKIPVGLSKDNMMLFGALGGGLLLYLFTKK